MIPTTLSARSSAKDQRLAVTLSIKRSGQNILQLHPVQSPQFILRYSFVHQSFAVFTSVQIIQIKGYFTEENICTQWHQSALKTGKGSVYVFTVVSMPKFPKLGRDARNRNTLAQVIRKGHVRIIINKQAILDYPVSSAAIRLLVN